VIDPVSGSDQPLVSENGRFVIAYNGEIYNHRDLRRELECRGRRFLTECDTEVVLAAFETWGTDCFSRFRGMFAIALWDARLHRLVLARDRLGIKPLYIYRSGVDLIFGSELKAILSHDAVPRYLDWEALQTYLSLNYVPGTRTLIKGIHKLPPGCFIEHTRGHIRTERYWRIPAAQPKKTSITESAAQLDQLLAESVREHVMSDMPVGVWVSGGVDSTTLLDYAVRQSSKRIKTFSVGFESSCCDESRYFREVSRHYGTQHEEIELRPNHEVISAIERFPYYSDEPGSDAGGLPVWFLSKLSRKSVTVALSGEGSDELFGGYLTYKANRYAQLLRTVPRPFRRQTLNILERLWPVSDEKISLEYKVKRLLRGSMMHPDEAHLYWNGTFAGSELGELLPDGTQAFWEANPLLSLYSQLGPEQDRVSLNRYLQFDQNYYLPDNLLSKVDRMSMAHSVEVRPPFLDHRILEFASTLPENFKIRGGTQKFLLKYLMRKRLPKCVLTRPKAGFDIPAHAWLRHELRPLLMETLSPGAVQRAGIFSPEAIQLLIARHMDRSINVGYHLWGLMTLHLWLKTWNVDTRPPLEQESSPAVHAVAS
jgi:asparagine synthase (glutamine-hydrolysing)